MLQRRKGASEGCIRTTSSLILYYILIPLLLLLVRGKTQDRLLHFPMGKKRENSRKVLALTLCLGCVAQRILSSVANVTLTLVLPTKISNVNVAYSHSVESSFIEMYFDT